jgi:hypothetical protein
MKSLGTTKQGVILQVDEFWQPISADIGGEAPFDYIYLGRSIIVSCIGLDPVLFDAANLFREGTLNDVGTSFANIGTVIDNTTANQILEIYERSDTVTPSWKALIAEPIKNGFNLQSSSELQFPLQFMIVPDATGKLFTSVPTYLSA